MKILIATKNPAKAREIKEFMGNVFELMSLGDFPDAPDIEETGKTFEENAVLKAKFYFGWSGKIPVIADDSGLAIDYLNGEPGVKSRRWPGHEASDQELIDMTLDKLRGVPWEKRTAYFKVVLVYYDGQNLLTESDGTSGFMVDKQTKQCESGFPFRSIFWVPPFAKLYQDLTPYEHEIINHRRHACERLKDKILKLAK